jgi:hypothetical protein
LRLHVRRSANKSRCVKGEIFRLGDRPELLPNGDWRPAEQVIVPATPFILNIGHFPDVDSIALRVYTKSRENFESFMEKTNTPYYLYGVKISKRLFAEDAPDHQPLIPYRFPGSGAQVRLVETEDGWWLRVLQRLQMQVDGYELLDAHGLLSAADLLSIARNEWSINRMITVGWRIGASPEDNMRGLTR